MNGCRYLLRYNNISGMIMLIKFLISELYFVLSGAVAPVELDWFRSDVVRSWIRGLYMFEKLMNGSHMGPIHRVHVCLFSPAAFLLVKKEGELWQNVSWKRTHTTVRAMASQWVSLGGMPLQDTKTPLLLDLIPYPRSSSISFACVCIQRFGRPRIVR